MAEGIWTSDDLAAAKAALLQALQGKTVSFADRSFTAQDVEELRSLVADMTRVVTGSRGVAFAAFSKGV